MTLSVGVAALGLASEAQTGVGHHTVELLRHLPDSRSSESFHYLGDLKPDKLPEAFSYHYHRGNTFLSRLYNDHYGIGSAAESLELDVLHAPKSSLPLGFSGTTSVTIHDIIFLTHPEHYSIRDRLYWNLSSTISLRRTDGIVTVSRASARAIKNNFSVEDQYLEVIPNGIDPERFTPSTNDSDAEWLTKYGITTPYYLYLGSNHSRKNLVSLLDAYAWAHNCWNNTLPPLVLAGPIPQSVLDHLDEETAKERIKLVGYVSEEALPAILRGAERLVYPSYAEGFGLPVLQALSCGTPVACSDLDVLREVAGSQAWYFDPTDLDSLTESLDPTRSSNVPVDFRRKLVEEFKWSTVAERYRKYFRRLANA